MAAGCAIVATDTEAVREFIDDGRTGRVVGDEESLYESALMLLRDCDAARALGVAAREAVHGRYARDVTLPVLAEQFDRLMAGKVLNPSFPRSAWECRPATLRVHSSGPKTPQSGGRRHSHAERGNELIAARVDDENNRPCTSSSSTTPSPRSSAGSGSS